MAKQGKDVDKAWLEGTQGEIRDKETERGRWRERLCRSLDLLPDCLSGESLIEIRGRGLLRLRGGGKILLYTPQRICIALKRGRLSIKGARLVCIAYHAETVEIEGEIGSVSFEEEI